MTTEVWPDTAQLGAARTWLRELAMAGGGVCPCCAQRAQVYRRAITSPMARDLISLVRVPVLIGEAFHLPTLLGYGGDAAKLAYWGLLEPEPGQREDGGRAGWWRLTELGWHYAHGRATVQRHALVYDGRVLRLDGEYVGIVVALGKRFNLRALLDGEQ